MLCSIIVAHYNRPEKLNRLLKTIPIERENETEVIVVDDISNKVDEQKAELICSQFSNVRFIKNSLDRKGPGGARNVALEVANGDWIIIADSDDKFDKENLNRLIKAIKNSSSDLIFFGVDEFGNGSRKRMDRLNNVKKKISDNKILVANNYGATWGIAYKKGIIDKSNAKFLEGVFIGEDGPFSLCSISLSKKVGIVNDIVYYVENHEESLTHQKLKKKKRLKIRGNDGYKKFMNKLDIAKKLKKIDRNSYEYYVTYRVKPLTGIINFNLKLRKIWQKNSDVFNKALIYFINYRILKKTYKNKFEYIEKININKSFTFHN
ncbi:glycosyltransferase family 2 protein [uncultured Ilyobacter sp.]|uniref:glycosyltransferase family 2 protein n=1 Tax=uncultured Ilyobacter sp. TaxID=544433 RepID=UPI002AA930B5|nr:glycosyltransferase family 2 protein [uncultured Ilyobacter sp.]